MWHCYHHSQTFARVIVTEPRFGVFSSSGYWDVSLPQVVFNPPMNSANDNLIFHQIGLPHSDIPGSKVACHLTEAYRRLLRPSSSFHTKASTICTYCGLTTRMNRHYLLTYLKFNTTLTIYTNLISTPYLVFKELLSNKKSLVSKRP